MSARRDPFQEPQGPILSLDEATKTVVARFAPPIELVLAKSIGIEEKQLQRWIVGAITLGQLHWMEFWLPPTSARNEDLWARLLKEGYDLTWGTAAATGRVVPAAVHSWSFLWTDGPKPLRIWRRVWERADTLMDLRDGIARGRVFNGREYPTKELGPASIRRSLFRESCIVQTPDGDATIARRLRFSGALFVFLAELMGALDPEPPSGAPLEALEVRINEVLARASIPLAPSAREV